MTPWYEQSKEIQHLCLHSSKKRKRRVKRLNLLWLCPLALSLIPLMLSLVLLTAMQPSNKGGNSVRNENARSWRDLRIYSGKGTALESHPEKLCILESRYPKTASAPVQRYVLPEYCMDHLLNHWTRVSAGSMTLVGWTDAHVPTFWKVGYLYQEYRIAER